MFRKVDPLVRASFDGRLLSAPWKGLVLGVWFHVVSNEFTSKLFSPRVLIPYLVVESKVSPVHDEDAKQRIRGMQQQEIPIEKRRALYNQMGRRFKNPAGLKPGLLQKYNACLSSKKDRFTLLKEFLIDPNMFLT